jgi:multidrug resistance efflux pump
MRLLLIVMVFTAAGLVSGCAADRDESRPTREPQTPAFSAPGRIEGATEPLEIGAAIDGVLESVHVEEGEEVVRGGLLARIACDDHRAATQAADAQAEAAALRLRILQNGTRVEDLALARARAAAARAARDRAVEFERRMLELWDERLIPADDRDRARRDREVAEAVLAAADAERQRAEAGPLADELHEARALAQQLRATAVELAERVKKCDVRAPASGTVLKRLMLPGELVSTAAPRPIVTFASLSEFRVRAEVDEHDVERVTVGMPALVSSPGWGDRRYRGVVIALSDAMGRRRVRSGDPAEKSDRDIREVIVRLEPGRRFVIGLRVDVVFDAPAVKGDD